MPWPPPVRAAQVVVLTCILGILLPADSGAEERKKAPSKIVGNDAGLKPQSFLTLKHSGYFRFRSDLFLNADLGNGSSGFHAPIHKNVLNSPLGEEGDTIAGANLRFRWRPELWIGQRLRIVTVIDVMDNVVLGSTDNYAAARPDVPLNFLTESNFGFSDAIRVKQLWGEWNILHTVLLRVGRMADHFGMGMVHNGGECIDCDFGDTTDRASLLIKAFGFHSLWFFDMPQTGATTKARHEAFGQASDGTETDDVTRWGFTIGMKPMEAVAHKQRKQDLRRHKPVVDWAIRNTFTTQSLTSSLPIENLTCGLDAKHPLDAEFDCITLRDRGVSLWVPDAWVRLEWWPRFDLKLRVELEVAGLVGEADATQGVNEPSSAKDFLGMGAVLQVEVEHRKLAYSLEFGIATGDDIAFGYFGPGFGLPDDSEYAANEKLQANKDINRFLFHRDYHVDMILYRQVIGGVTNSFYLKPSVLAHILKSDEMALGGELAVIYAHAIDKDSTPGRAAPMGVEIDANIFYSLPGLGRMDLDLGVLFPLGAFENGTDPDVAFTIQGRITTTF